MKCEDFNRMLDNYENLTTEEKLSMNEHAEQCEKCRDELDFMMKIIAELNTLPGIQPPEDFIYKLNKRIDAEAPVKTNSVLAVVRRNYKQLSTVAACLLIAVVIGANGKSLIDKMPSDAGNDSNVPTVSTAMPLKEDRQIAANTPSEQPKPVISDEQTQKKVTSGFASGNDSKMVAAAVPQSNAGRNIEPIREMSESINMIEKPNTSVVAPKVINEDLGGKAAVATEDTSNVGKNRMVQEPVITAYNGEPEKSSSKFKIARGIYYLPNSDVANAQSTPEPQNDDYVVKIKENKDISIARGRYYVRTNEGYVNIKDNEIEIGSDDAKRALELIEQYIDETADSEYYVINTENITPMLEHMDKEGINYQHNIEEEMNERVGFKVKID